MWLRVDGRGDLLDSKDGFNTAHFGKSHSNRQLKTDCKMSESLLSMGIYNPWSETGSSSITRKVDRLQTPKHLPRAAESKFAF